MQLDIPGVTAMEDLAGKIASCSTARLMVLLQGPLGAGKTTFVRGFMRQLGYSGIVKSPTYTLVEPYCLENNPVPVVYHFDLYRLASPGELEDIGLRDYLDQSAVCLIEWPEKAGDLLGEADLTLRIDPSATITNLRHVELAARTSAGDRVLDCLAAAR